MKPAELYILQQPEPYKSMLMHLQMIIEHHFKEAELLFKWKIPFYYLDKKPFCYLNPSHKKGYVDVGFWLSTHLEKYNHLLVSDKRKVIKSLRYFKVDEIDEQILVAVLQEVYHKKSEGFYKKS